MRTGELKSYAELDMFDNTEEYGLYNCGTCLRNGFHGRHLQKFHHDFLRSKSSHTKRDSSNFRTSKYRNRSRSHSVSSADDQHRRGRRERSRSRSSSRGSISDSRRGRHRSGKSSPHSPSPHSNRPPTPLPTVQFEN